MKTDPDAAKFLKYSDGLAIKRYDTTYVLHAGTEDDLPDWLFRIANDSVPFEGIMHILIGYYSIETQIMTQKHSMHTYIHTCIHAWMIST
jgi:hypothetical protein